MTVKVGALCSGEDSNSFVLNKEIMK